MKLKKVYLHKIYIYIIYKIIFKMKLRSFVFIFYFIILSGSAIFILGKPLIKFNKENTQRFLEEEVEYDTFVILYFKDCNYSKGFKNEYRNDINFIINRENNNKLTGEETLIVHQGFGIEIHFNRKVRKLGNFFSGFKDKNMEYLISIDFSNFDISSVTIMESMFYGCNSLESVDFSNIDTSSVIEMGSMFQGCCSLKSIDFIKI